MTMVAALPPAPHAAPPRVVTAAKRCPRTRSLLDTLAAQACGGVCSVVVTIGGPAWSLVSPQHLPWLGGGMGWRLAPLLSQGPCVGRG